MASSSPLSGPLKALADNPLGFLGKYAIEFAPIDVPPEYRSDDGATFRSGKAGVKLVLTRTATVYRFQFVAINDLGDDKEAVQAFVLGFKLNRRNDDAPFVDIPSKNAPYLEGSFVFTVGLTGCSVIVTRLDGNTYRVFHDRRMDSAVLYDNVEMCVNYNDDYRIQGRFLARTGKAFTCMQFKDGAWKLFVQRQLPPPDTTSTDWEIYVSEKKGPTQSLETTFNNQRSTVIQKRVKDNAQKLKVDKSLIDGAQDGVVRGVEYDEDAIRGWEALRKAIKRQIQIDREKGIPSSLKDTYDRYEDDVSDSKLMDETWIWLQVKKNKAKVQR